MIKEEGEPQRFRNQVVNGWWFNGHGYRCRRVTEEELKTFERAPRNPRQSRRPRWHGETTSEVIRPGTVEVFFDGSCGPQNPGGAMGFGVLIRRGEEELFSARRSEPASQRNSNNVAEYKSLIIALEWLEAIGYLETPVLVRGDSKLVIEQMSGRWKIKTGFYAAQARKAKELAARFKDIRYQWIPREENEKADSLSRKESPETA